MLCSSLAVAVALLVVSALTRRNSIIVFTTIFLFAFFIIWGLFSIVPLGPTQKDNMFQIKSYARCLDAYKICALQTWGKIQERLR